jgi:hypothetical protein
MKTLEKLKTNGLPKAKFIKVDSFPFLDGVELFPEKNARAEKALKNIKLPPR